MKTLNYIWSSDVQGDGGKKYALWCATLAFSKILFMEILRCEDYSAVSSVLSDLNNFQSISVKFLNLTDWLYLHPLLKQNIIGFLNPKELKVHYHSTSYHIILQRRISTSSYNSFHIILASCSLRSTWSSPAILCFLKKKKNKLLKHIPLQLCSVDMIVTCLQMKHYVRWEWSGEVVV